MTCFRAWSPRRANSHIQSYAYILKFELLDEHGSSLAHRPAAATQSSLQRYLSNKIAIKKITGRRVRRQLTLLLTLSGHRLKGLNIFLKTQCADLKLKRGRERDDF